MADLWDCIDGDMWHQALPPTSLVQAISGCNRSLLITRSGNDYELYKENGLIHGTFPTLEEAKGAGQRMVDELEAGYRDSIIVAEGLDPAQWVLDRCEQGDVVIIHKASDCWIQGHSNEDWEAMAPEEVSLGTSTTLAACEALVMGHVAGLEVVPGM